MRKKMISVLKRWMLPTVFFGALLCGCSNSSGNGAENPLGEIQVVAREENSGTKAQFEEILGLYSIKEDVVAESTEDMISAVENEAAAIGYAANIAVQDADVKILTVDGVKADTDGVKSGKYPLSRDYSLVYNGELNELQEDFLSYIKSAGQKLVAEYCIPVSAEKTFLSNQASGTITVCGSSSMDGVIHALAEEYKSLNTNAEIEITITDSGDGIQKAMQGGCDFGMASRALKDYEKELLECFVLGRDGIAVIVNKENVAENITVEQLKAVYSGETSEWKEIK